MSRSIYREDRAASMVQLMSGLPSKGTIFLLGIPLDPPLAGMTANTFLFLINADGPYCFEANAQPVAIFSGAERAALRSSGRPTSSQGSYMGYATTREPS